MEFLIDNWYIILAFVVAIVYMGYHGYLFLQKTNDERLALVKEWLLWAVIQAERELGSGTGALKLRKVYDDFITHFPWLVQVFSFEQFCNLVDEALGNMDELIKGNKEIRDYVNTINE